MTSPTKKGRYAPPPLPTQEAQIQQAVIHQAVRFTGLLEAPLGQLGTEFGPAPVRVNYSLNELLFGLRGQFDPVDVSAVTWPTVDDVIRGGFRVDVTQFPAQNRIDVARALDTAITDVAAHITGGSWPGVG